MYGERGLAGRPVGLWLYGPQSIVVHRDEPLAQFEVAYVPGKRQLKTSALLRLLEAPFRSPQPWLCLGVVDQWRKAFRPTRLHNPTLLRGAAHCSVTVEGGRCCHGDCMPVSRIIR